MSLALDDKSIRRLVRVLKVMNRQGIMFAEQGTVNDLAFDARREGGEEIARSFTERNQWSRRSLSVRKATGRALEASMGTSLQYMADQQVGFTRDNVSIPTSFAGGQGKSAERTRKVIKARRRPNVQFNRTKKIKAKNKRQLIAIQIAMAKRAGEKYAFLNIPRAEGVYLIKKRGVMMVYDHRKESTVTQAKPWLTNTRERTTPKANKFFARRIKQQLNRVGFK